MRIPSSHQLFMVLDQFAALFMGLGGIGFGVRRIRAGLGMGTETAGKYFNICFGFVFTIVGVAIMLVYFIITLIRVKRKVSDDLDDSLPIFLIFLILLAACWAYLYISKFLSPIF